MFTLTDNDGLSNGPSPYGVKGHGDVAVPLGAVPVGKLAQWQSTVSRSDPTYGEEGTGTWTILDDNRKTSLYLTADGSTYTIGSEVAGQSYPGYGPIPAWLTTTARPSPFYVWMKGAWVLDVAADTTDAQTTQTALMYQAYQGAISQPVTYKTAGGVTKAFQADADSQSTLVSALTGYQAAGAVPSGFRWVSEDNTQVPFTLDDLKGLAAAMLAQGWTAFQTLQTRKTSIRAASTRAEAAAIVW